MVNKNIFKTQKPVVTTRNNAGGHAYSMTAENALCQLAVTNCFNGTYYSSANDLLNKTKELVGQCKPETIAKIAVYARESGKMKDMPVFLLAYLYANGENNLADKIFARVIYNGKMLSNFMRIIRSGELGRKSFGSHLKNTIKQWISLRSNIQLFKDSIGISNPSMMDMFKMVHPKPENAEVNNFYRYLLGKECSNSALPSEVYEFEKFKKNPVGSPPAVDFRLLSNIKMSESQWRELSLTMSWDTLRRNLNTLYRNGVFNHAGVSTQLAAKLRDEKSIRGSNVFPYDIMTTYIATEGNIPRNVRDALHDALEISTQNIPAINGRVAICVDVSGSMSSPITGARYGATTSATCVQAASVIACSILRKNPDSIILPFDTSVHKTNLETRDSVMTNADKLRKYGGGGTCCELPIAELVRKHEKVDLVIMISDNESWAQMNPKYRGYGYHGMSGKTGMHAEWNKLKSINPKAKLVCIDLTPNTTVQVEDAQSVMNIGGMSDTIFTAISRFYENGDLDFSKVISEVKL